MKCPGQDMQYWNPDAIFEVACPRCHKSVEFYKDDPSRRCHHCGHRFVNPKMDFGCAAYCPFAEQCIGTLPEEFAGARESLLKDKVAVEIKRLLGNDFRRIGQVTRMARYAQLIATDERCPLAAVLCAAYFTFAPREDDQHQTTTLAGDILARLGADQQMIDRVVALLAEGGQEAEYTQERHILLEAKTLAVLESLVKESSPALPSCIAEATATLTTGEGKRLLQELLKATT